MRIAPGHGRPNDCILALKTAARRGGGCSLASPLPQESLYLEFSPSPSQAFNTQPAVCSASPAILKAADTFARFIDSCVGGSRELFPLRQALFPPPLLPDGSPHSTPPSQEAPTSAILGVFSAKRLKPCIAWHPSVNQRQGRKMGHGWVGGIGGDDFSFFPTMMRGPALEQIHILLFLPE